MRHSWATKQRLWLGSSRYFRRRRTDTTADSLVHALLFPTDGIDREFRWRHPACIAYGLGGDERTGSATALGNIE